MLCELPCVSVELIQNHCIDFLLEASQVVFGDTFWRFHLTARKDYWFYSHWFFVGIVEIASVISWLNLTLWSRFALAELVKDSSCLMEFALAQQQFCLFE